MSCPKGLVIPLVCPLLLSRGSVSVDEFFDGRPIGVIFVAGDGGAKKLNDAGDGALLELEPVIDAVRECVGGEITPNAPLSE